MAFNIFWILLLNIIISCQGNINQCSQGPQAWCHDLTLAKYCNATNHCKNMWKNTYPPTTQSDECQFCQLLLQDIKLKNIQDIHVHIQQSCDLASNENITKKCHVLETEIDIVKDLLEDISPYWICDSLKFCFKPQEQDTKMILASNDENLCELCKRSINGLEILLQKKSFEVDLLDYLERFCHNFSVGEEIMCKEGMKKMIPDMLRKIANILQTSNFCVKSEICNLNSMNMIAGNANLCNDCKKMIDQIRQFVDKSQDNVMDGARHVCQSFPTKIQEKCSSIIRNYIPAIYEYINMLINPVQTCQAVGICPSNIQYITSDELAEHDRDTPIYNIDNEADYKTKWVEFVQRLKVNGTDLVEKEKTPILSAADWPPNQAECELCNIIMTELLNVLGNNRTKENIIHALQSVCHLLPHMERQCQDFIKEYAEPILILTQNNLSANETCQLFDFCKNGTSSVSQPFLSISNSVEHSLDSTTANFKMDYCPICHIAVAWIGKQIGKNATDQQLMAFAEKFCHDLPRSFSQKCMNYVNDYGIDALRIIAEYMDPEIVCQKFGLCPASFERRYIA